MKNGDLLHNQCLMSHEDIIDLFNINDTNSNCDNFVRVEFSPKEKWNDSFDEDYNDSINIERYVLIVDEENVPDWFEKHRENVTSKLKDIVSKQIILTNQKILTDGLYIVGKGVVVDKLINGTIIELFGTVKNVSEGGIIKNVVGGTVQNVFNGGTVQNVFNGGTVQNVR
jgi:hypothetical protein